MIDFEPTSQQRDIISRDGNAVIVAGPGSGKTWTLAKKIQTVVQECRSYQGVVAISYTNKASKELEERAKLLCKETKQSFFSTIDSFCSSEIVLSFGKKVMGVPSIPVLVEKTQDIEQEKVVKDIKREIKKIIQKYSKQSIQELYEQRICAYEELSIEHRTYIQERFINGYFDLHLISGMANLILMSSQNCGNYLKAKYPYVFIDEFQDSDFEQYSLFRRFAELGSVSWAVGDFNQSIYSFKSGSPEYMEQLIEMESFQVFEMDINHRCHPFIQEYANLFQSIQKSGLKTFGPKGESRIVRVSIPGTQRQFGNWLNQNLEGIISMSGVEKRSNVAVLGRTHETLDMVAEVLQIPHRLHRKLLVDDDRSVGGSILKQLLMLTFNPRQYTTKDFVDSYFDNRVRGVRRNIDSLKKLVQKFKFECQESIKNHESDEQIIHLLKEIVEVIYPDYELNEHTRSACRQLIASPIMFENFKPFKNDEIQLLTIHGAKGLEFDVVLHLDLYEDTFPDFRSIGNPTKEQEDVNLHYIALTRAREYVFLIVNSKKRFFSWRNGSHYEFNKQPSPYILGAIAGYQKILS